MDHWRLYCTATGKAVVRKELDALGREQKAALAAVQKRYNNDALFTNELESLDDGLFALRTTIDGMALRLYFGKVGRGGAICLAVHVLNKKSKKAPKKDLDLARDRLREWNARTRGLPKGAN